MTREESAKEYVPREMGRIVCNWRCTRGSVLSREGDCRGTPKLQDYSQTLGGRHSAVTNCSQKRTSWNQFIPVNKAVTELSKCQAVFLHYESQWKVEFAKAQNGPTSVHPSGSRCYCPTQLIMLWIVPCLHMRHLKILDNFKKLIMSKTHPQKLFN